MRKSLIAAALCATALLAGCGSFQVATPKTPRQVYADSVGAYDVVRIALNKYEALPACPTNAPVCKDAGIVATAEATDAKVWAAIQAAKPVVEADNPNADALTRVMNDLAAALSAYEGLQAQWKVN